MASDADSQPLHSQPRKRRRLMISCTECHRRKQKCDRELPCGNCKLRNKEAACMYETNVPTARWRQQHQYEQRQKQAKNASATPPEDYSDPEDDEPLSAKAAGWGYGQNTVSTMVFLKQIETVDGNSPSPTNAKTSAYGSPSEDDFTLREKYKGLIRQLPAKVYIDKLVDLFLRSLNWQYYTLDTDIFREQLEQWNNLSFKVLSTVGPRGLSPSLRTFPALLFQVIATALLLLPERPDPVFDALKYVGSMRFEDLAVEYSDSGAAILDLLGKKNVSLETVQAQFLRASFFKFTAKVTEAWHAISVAVRDAQDLGMHKDSLDPQPKDSSVEAILENQWLIQRRRRIYILLAIWDINCACILGRPGVIDWNRPLPTPPIDAPLPTNRASTPVVPRGENDPPTPVTRVIWNIELSKLLQAIRNLENEEAYQSNFAKVDQLHQRILDCHEKIPASFRLDDPDTRWDDEPEMQWLQACRFYFAQLHQFGLMALHRPYVFHRKESRAEAIQASLRMLEVQKMTFQGLPPDTWRNYLLFFGSFDAIVLIASVYILFPYEHTELTGSVLQHFQWTVERFQAIQERNPLAKSAQGVLRAIVARFRKAIANPGASRSPYTPADMRLGVGHSMPSTTESTPGTSSISPGEGFEFSQAPAADLSGGWTMPSADCLASLAPMFPMGDIIYNDLNVIHDGVFIPSVTGEQLDKIGTNNFDFVFGGDLGNDTVWQILNQVQQPTDGEGGLGAAGVVGDGAGA
ncbi:hypothetical protein BGZ63DRAFT_346626 [Mariannaea sp. PMI_226]|nr:hypothetical protein BGZ63DRAFT_346626 [Mariannaea sp. PMI_226]